MRLNATEISHKYGYKNACNLKRNIRSGKIPPPSGSSDPTFKWPNQYVKMKHLYWEIEE